MNGPNDREAMTRRLHRLQVAVGGMRRRCNNLNLGADPCQIENMLQQKLSRLQSLKAQNDQLDAVLEGGKRKAQRDEPNARLKDNLIIQVRFAQAVHQQAQRDVRDAEKKLREDEVVLDKTENLLKKRSMCPASPAMMQVDTIRQLEKHKEMLAQSIDVGEKRYQSQRRELLRIIQDRREKMDEIQADIKPIHGRQYIFNPIYVFCYISIILRALLTFFFVVYMCKARALFFDIYVRSICASFCL
eukprot:GEMP01028979.1.p1 GENE.GEMP01028979.1~~GEMP01028979.1.p1  ORF type:complete len:255 (+),score=37.95 GEMP01028979.1:33-767(+)